MVRKGGGEDNVLKLPEARTCHCRVFGYKEQTHYLQEAPQKEGFKNNIGFRERF